MYKVQIKTKYNVINMEITDPNDPNFIEILEQPYILEVRIEEIKEKVLTLGRKNVNI